MDVAHLRDFVVVVESGSLSRAAGALHVSQPTISMRMAQLESALGTRLFDRGPRGVEPTPAGRSLYADAQRLIRQFESLVENVTRDRGQVRGPVAIGLPTTTSSQLTPQLFAWIRRHHPGVRLQVFESISGYLQELLVAGRLDLAVLYRESAAPRAGEVPLYSEDLYLVGASGSGPDGTDVDLGEVATVPLVLPGARSNIRLLLDRAFAAAGRTPDIVGDVESLNALLDIAAGGDACTVLPLSCVVGDHRRDRLRIRRVVGPVIARTVSVAPAAEYYEPADAVREVMRAVVDVTRELFEHNRWRGIRLHAPRDTGYKTVRRAVSDR